MNPLGNPLSIALAAQHVRTLLEDQHAKIQGLMVLLTYGERVSTSELALARKWVQAVWSNHSELCRILNAEVPPGGVT